MTGPRYQQIVESLAGDIAAGRLVPGERLPTQRDLADALGVSLGTVTRAYTEAHRRGLIAGEVGRGTFVLDAERRATGWGLAAAADHRLIDLSLLEPPRAGPTGIASALAATLAEVAGANDFADQLEYQPHPGMLRHRAAGAAWVEGSGLACGPEEVLVCASGQHALAVALTTVVRPGEVVFTESLTSPGIKDLAAWAQIRLHGLPTDRDGLIPAAFDAASRVGVARTLYTMPTLHNPTAITTPDSRRREIAAIAAAHHVTIIEDGVNDRLADAPPPLASYAADRAFYLTSLSKVIAPGVRIGYLRPPPSATGRAIEALRATMWMAPPLMGEIAARWIGDGTAERLLELRRAEARARQEAAAAALGAYEYRADGYHVWLELPVGWRSEAFAERAKRRGVSVTASEVFVAGRGHPPAAVRLCLSGAEDMAQLEQGLGILLELLQDPPSGAVAV